MEPPTLIIPAAGLGTRMRHVLPGVPKELLPLGGKPALQYSLVMGREAGCSRAVVVLRPGKESIARWIEHPRPGRQYSESAVKEMQDLVQAMDVALARQNEPLGEADAIAKCRGLVQGRRLVVAYPDNIHIPASGEPSALLVLARAMPEQHADLVALMDPGVDDSDEANPGVSDSGRVDLEQIPGNLPRIRAFLPKGQGPFIKRFAGELRTCGVYAALPHFLDFIEKARALTPPGSGLELTDGKVRRVMLEAGVPFYGVRVSGQIFDVGNPEGFARCRAHLGDAPLA